MAQDASTVTPPNSSPPTNMSFTGTTAPNPPNYTKNTYGDRQNWGSGTPSFPAPFYDDGTAGALQTVATKTAALASGSGATGGGNEGTYPGTGTNYANVNNVGAVPASTSATAEAFGTEVVVTAPGSRSVAPTLAVSTTVAAYTTSPNSDHASNYSLTSISPTSTVSGGGTQLMTLTGTGFRSNSVIYVNGVAQTTTFVSATSLTATVTKKATAGTWPVAAVTNGVSSEVKSWTFT